VSLITERPEVGEPRDWRFPAFERRTVAGGRLLACHLPGRPLAATALVVDAGAALEPTGREGVAELVARAFSEGTAAHDAYEFGVAAERLGATWRASSDWDSLRLGLEVPVSELSAATELLAEAVQTASFDDEVLTRVLDERVDELSLERSQPASRGAEAFAAAVFADGSRYDCPDGGNPDSLDRIELDDIRAYRAARVRRDAMTMIVVGDLDSVDLEELGRLIFDGWNGELSEAKAPSVSARAPGRRVVIVDRPGSVQSALLIGHDGPPRASDDYVAMTTMSLVLGGMFSSRLNLKIREEKGYSYGAFGGYDTRKHGGVFAARAAVQSDVTAPALADMVSEIERMQADGVEPAELEQARAYRSGVFPINFAGVMAVGAGLGDLVVHHFADDHFDRLRQQVIDVKLDEVNLAASTRLRPDDLVTVVVGDASACAEAISDLGLGEVTILPDDQ
jgi:predicted Zn-dependent peptidase